LKSLYYKVIIIAVIIVTAFITGYLIAPNSSGDNISAVENGEESHEHDMSENAQVWTCSMHPQIKLPKPGKCPICFMDLIPLEIDENEDESIAKLTMSESAKILAEIKTVAAEKKVVVKTVRVFGKIDYDESRLSYVTAWIPGRIDKLHYNFTGVEVKRGSPLVYVYSPELMSAQEEYLQALKIYDEIRSNKNKEYVEMAERTMRSSEKKLELFGLAPAQIKEIKEKGESSDHITIFSPITGTVIQKNGFEGMYVKTGTKIYTIADLSHVWAWMDVYESDMIWLSKGQAVDFTVEAYPGEHFTGKVAFIDPFLNEKSRAVRVRVNIPNSSNKLKPGMLVRGKLQTMIPKGGENFKFTYVEKWVCPMECEEPHDKPGICSVCKMDLVKGKVLDKKSQKMQDSLPLVIPVTAPLVTGERAIVYVEDPEAEKPTYTGKVIELGSRVEEFYIVKSGLNEGDRVVVEGNFKIDSELQLRAKQSMMSIGKKNSASSPQQKHNH